MRTCSICGTEFEGWGNNPVPLRPEVEDRCCDDCNTRWVVPVRILNMDNPAGARYGNPDFMAVLCGIAKLARNGILANAKIRELSEHIEREDK